MARNSDPGMGSIAGPAALLALALLAMALHFHLGALPPGSPAAAAVGPRPARMAGASASTPWAAQVAALLGAAGLVCLSLVIRVRGQRLVAAGVLGRARAARGRDLRALRRSPALRNSTEPRVRLGTHHRRSLWLPADEHLLVLGPTGSGKSSGLAIPALLEWPGPAVVTDPKGELVRATLAHRSSLGPAVIFAPLMEPTSRWNPLTSIVSSEDALRVANFLMGRAPDREPFWHDLARQLLHGLLVEGASLEVGPGALLELLQIVPAEALAEEMRHPVARRLVQGALSGGDRTAMGVVATLVAQLGPYSTDQVAAATAESDFDPAGLADGSLRTLYCVVAPHDAPVLRGLVSALISRAWRSIFSQPPQPPALFLLDEFTQLTNLPELPALAQLGRSQGVRLVLMAQDLGSITATYGTEASGALWSNCRTKILLPGISELELLDRASRLAGTTTLHRVSELAGSEPVSSHPLWHPDDVRRLKPHQALVFHGGDHPAVIAQRRWYEVARLKALVGATVPDLVPSPAQGRPLRDRIDANPDWIASADPLTWEPADVEA
ncbi:MAG TPA: type IV secretory system conjugative DNA transfer family protein [Candidatus Dormibacteraeota bacterium]